LRRSEKLAAAGRLAATVAHEINNPLEAVTNLIFLGANAKGLPEEAGGYLEQASEELRRVAHIVSQTLGFYRDSSTPRLTDISVLMRDVLYLYNRKLENRGIRLCRSVDEGVYAMVIAGEIRQVVANLVANAIDAMPSGGVLGAQVYAHPDSVEIAISDTGHGIPPAELESIFEAFYTTKKDTGTGLGLWVSKSIAEKHHGTLTVKSSQQMEDHGTVFTMVLPRMWSDTGEPIKRQS
jgi:signal transduction histidine kinase